MTSRSKTLFGIIGKNIFQVHPTHMDSPTTKHGKGILNLNKEKYDDIRPQLPTTKLFQK